MGGNPVTGHEGDVITARLRSARAKKLSLIHIWPIGQQSIESIVEVEIFLWD